MESGSANELSIARMVELEFPLRNNRPHNYSKCYNGIGRCERVKCTLGGKMVRERMVTGEIPVRPLRE